MKCECCVYTRAQEYVEVWKGVSFAKIHIRCSNKEALELFGNVDKSNVTECDYFKINVDHEDVLALEE